MAHGERHWHGHIIDADQLHGAWVNQINKPVDPETVKIAELMSAILNNKKWLEVRETPEGRASNSSINAFIKTRKPSTLINKR